MYSCYSILECYNLFSGVKLSIRWFCFIFAGCLDVGVVAVNPLNIVDH